MSMETVGMWQQAGFLASAFACFFRRRARNTVSTTQTRALNTSAMVIHVALTIATHGALSSEKPRPCAANISQKCNITPAMPSAMRAPSPSTITLVWARCSLGTAR